LIKSGSEFRFEPGTLAGAIAQEIQARSADVRVAVDNYFLDHGRTREESALNPDAIAGDTPHSEVGIVPAAVLADDGALEFLSAHGGAFFDAHKHADVIT
jgi:hypothetical protein